MALLTKWEVGDIQASIVESMTAGGRVCDALFMPNISFGFFKAKGMECDLLHIYGNNRLEEFEIKRSREDFVVDFKKQCFHDDVRITRFSYVLPEALAGDWLKGFIIERYKTFRRMFNLVFYREYDCSIIKACHQNKYVVDPKFTLGHYFTQDMVDYVNDHDPAWRYRRGLFTEELCTLYRLTTIRFWQHECSDFRERRKKHLTPCPGATYYLKWYEVDADGKPLKREDPVR